MKLQLKRHTQFPPEVICVHPPLLFLTSIYVTRLSSSSPQSKENVVSIFGIIGDRLGWGRTIIWFGGVGCAVGVLLFYYAPEIWNNFWFILACGGFWCVMLAGYVPLSALVPSLVDKDKGAAVSVLNLGAGLAVFIGPLLVKLLKEPIGYSGIVWVMAALYIVSSILTYFIAKPSKA